MQIIPRSQERNRLHWVSKINQLSGNFGVDSDRVESELSSEIRDEGIESLIGHLRLCGAIPASYRVNSSEEKLFSKYTDVVIHEAFKAMGFRSLVLKERAGVADVECVAPEYGFVADAKAFRLSRTTVNQKDLKISSMNSWKHGKPYATVVCPSYQMPSRKSAIYQDAATYSVLISTYTHLTVAVRYAAATNTQRAVELMQRIFESVERLNPAKSASDYWRTINNALISFDPSIVLLWREEKLALLDAISISKKEALQVLASERERIMKLSHDEAIQEALKLSKLESRIREINKVSDNGILNQG